MKLQLEIVVLTIVIIKMDHFSQASLWSTQSKSEKDVYLPGHTLKSFKTKTILECYDKCEKNPLCYSINVRLSDKTCELKSTTKVRRSDDIIQLGNVIYMEVREHIIPGENQAHPLAGCKSLKNSPTNASSGVYWIKLNGKAVQVYCEMETDGGGWTLVYSHGFTAYESFTQNRNAVTPKPTWVLPSNSWTHTPRSTTIPLNTTAKAAMDFSLWKLIGNEFLIASDINDWYSCVDGGDRNPKGSLVNWITGSLTCKRVKEVVPRSTFTCTPAEPNSFVIGACDGAIFRRDANTIYAFNTAINACFPYHDPCGTTTTQNRYRRGVVDPHGQIYIR